MKWENVIYSKESSALLQEKADNIWRYLQLCAEYGCLSEGQAIYDDFNHEVNRAMNRFEKLVTEQRDEDEPDDLDSILAKRPDGLRKSANEIPDDFHVRLEGAFYGRMAGCTLGAGMEGRTVETMKFWAEHFGDSYPLQDYWKHVQSPNLSHYITGREIDLTRGHMDAVPPDDDTAYTLLGLLLLEKYGENFNQEDLGKIWMKYLPLGEEEGSRGCWWGERSMLKNLLAGEKFPEAGIIGNPNLQNIAAWTRADAYGYAFPGQPEKAAGMAYKDASVNHRRNGIYGSMFMAAVISAAFVSEDAIEAVRIGLKEIPEKCMLAEAIHWTLEQSFAGYQDAADKIYKKYQGMFWGSSILNAVLVVAGLKIGKGDFTKTIGETVAMGGDNDCTGATAGSILGAVIGKNSIPAHWTEPFKGRMHIYLKGMPEYLEIGKVTERFERLAHRFWKEEKP